jgi:enterobactin synthetase component D
LNKLTEQDISRLSEFVTDCYFEYPYCHKAVSILIIDYNSQQYSDLLFTLANITMPDSIRQSYPKRRTEFFAGRLVASWHLLKRFGCNDEIIIHQDRSPVWPLGIIGSLSHTNQNAVCLLAPKSDVLLLGVDIENIMSTKIAMDTKELILTPDEEWLFSANNFVLEELTTIVFSAKESLFKALYPKVNYFFDFFSASVILIDTAKKELTLVLNKDLGEHYKKGDFFIAYYSFKAEKILTIVLA